MKKTKLKLIVMVLVISIAIMSLGACSFGNSYDNAERYQTGNFTYESSQVNQIEINWTSGKVLIVQTDNATLNVSETATSLNDDQKMRWLIENNKLSIQFCKSKYKGTIDANNKHLTIEIPKSIDLDIDITSSDLSTGDLELSDFELETTSGNVEMGNITSSRDINVESVSGTIKLGNLTASDSVDIDSTSGDIKVGDIVAKSLDIEVTSAKVETGTINSQNTEIDTVSGQCNLNIEKSGATEIKSTSGDITITLVGEDGISLTHKSTSGEMITDLTYTVSNGKKVFKTGTSSVEFKSVSGNLTIN